MYNCCAATYCHPTLDSSYLPRRPRCAPPAHSHQVLERKAELARLETLDMGKPIAEAEWDMDDVAACVEYYAGRCTSGARARRGAWIGALPVLLKLQSIRLRPAALPHLGPTLLQAWRSSWMGGSGSQWSCPARTSSEGEGWAGGRGRRWLLAAGGVAWCDELQTASGWLVET